MRGPRPGAARVELFYLAGCRNARPALRLLRQVIAELDAPAAIAVRKVRSLREAERLSFAGSPTVRVDGHDVEPPRASLASLSCRLYREGDAVRGYPSERTIRRALER